MSWRLRMLLAIEALDVFLSNAFVNMAKQFVFLRQLKRYYMFLNILSCGLMWLIPNLLLIRYYNNFKLNQMHVNLLIGLVLGSIIVNFLKEVVGRPRPKFSNRPIITENADYAEYCSFPSARATRVAFVTYFFIYLWPLPLICVPPLLAWSFSVCVSKLLMREHHIADVLAGIALGIFLGMFIGKIFLERETCAHLVLQIFGEETSGAEYDV